MNRVVRSPARRAELYSWIGPALIVAAVAVTYANSLRGAFQFDDIPAILENPTLRHPGNLLQVLAPPGEQAGTVAGRPMVNLSLALNTWIGGTRTWGYHVFNVIVHAGAALLLYGILRRTLQGRPSWHGSPDPCRASSAYSDHKGIHRGPSLRGSAYSTGSGRVKIGDPGHAAADHQLLAFFAALLWAVHPLQTEAVTYVVQRAESLMGLFYFLTLYCFIRYSEPIAAAAGRGRGRWLVLGVLACLLGMATKEVMVSAPLVVLLYDRTFVAGSVREAWRRRRGWYLSLGATWLLLALLVVSTHGRGGSAGYGTSVTVGSYLLTQCAAIVRYLRLAFWPNDLVFDYGTGLVHHLGKVVGPVLLVVLLLAGTAYALCRHPATGFVALCFFAWLAPSSSLVPIVTEPMAEHRMYLPLAAVLTLVVAAMLALLARASPCRGRIAFSALGLAAALGLGAATIRRNRDYGSEIALWTDTVRKMPSNARAHNNLAEAFRTAGESTQAAAEFAAAVQVDPEYAPAQYNLGVTLLDSGHPQEAVPHLEKALVAPRHQAELQLYLGEACERLGRPADAAGHYRAALQRAPGNADAAFGLGNTLAAQGRYAEAVDAFRAAVALAPDRIRVRNNLANALAFSGRLQEAIAEYRAALRRDPNNGAIRENLERALAAQAAR